MKAADCTTMPDSFSCRDFSETVTDYLETSLAPEMQRGVERHLAVCPPCRAYLAQMKRTIATIGAVFREAPEVGYSKRLRALFRERHGPEPPQAASP